MLSPPERRLAGSDTVRGWATHYLAGEDKKARALTTDVRIPPALSARATEVEAHMQKLCEYQFGDDGEIAPLLALYSPGTGYRDMASDLVGYAGIYDMRPEAVAADRKHYRPTDRDDAIAIANEILLLLAESMTPEQRELTQNFLRAWAHLQEMYGEVQSAGLFLERADPTAPERYPSLFAATRTKPAKAKAEAPATPAEEPTTPAEQPTAAAGPAAPKK